MLELTKNEQKALMIIIFFLLAGAGVRIYGNFKGESNVIPVNKYSEPVATSNPLELPTSVAESPTPQKQKNIIAHICGGVKSPGVYTLPENSRVKDFIYAAGGTSKDGIVDAINLARIVGDGEKIVIPQAGKTGSGNENGSTDSEPVMQNSPEEHKGKININTATLADLDSIPGIGPVIAQRIIDHRNGNGNFKSVEDIKNVKGIGEKTFEKIKDYIEVKGGQ
ncbi:MAG: helix-hairpin-helix domain-containing protein [Candidatus Eremiobacterota bacterium]